MTWLAGEREKASLDRRWFALFVVAQACALGLAVALPTKIAYAVLAGIGGGLFLTFLLL